MTPTIPTWTQFATGQLAKDFTGVVYCDTGKLNYGAVVNGKLLTMKNGRNRWFASASAARLAIKEATPNPDLTVSNHGSIMILRSATQAGRDWICEHIPADAHGWGGGIVVEPRYIDAIVEGAIADGLEVA
jgi:hypothetical protein